MAEEQEGPNIPPEIPSPEQRLWQLFDNIPQINMLDTLLKGGGTDPEFIAVTRTNFELGGIFYHKIKTASPSNRVSVGLARSGDLEAEMRDIEQTRLRGIERLVSEFEEDYLAKIRAYRISAERELWNLNIRRIRLSPKDRAQTADMDAKRVRQLQLNSAAAQLNGTAQAALKDNDLQSCLLLCEAAGDFLPEGQTVIKINENLTHKNETLEKVLEFIDVRRHDPLVVEVFRGTMSSIGKRIQDKQASISGFEKTVLPTLGKPGDVMYQP